VYQIHSLKSHLQIFSLLIVSFTLLGCSKVDSQDLRTAGFHADIDVEAVGNKTKVDVRLRTGRGIDADWIRLSAGDQLVATMNNVSVPLRSVNNSYDAWFDDTTENSKVTVALIRDLGVNAENSFVQLPELFEITAPDTQARFSVGETVTLT